MPGPSRAWIVGAAALLALALVAPGLSGRVLDEPRPLPGFTHGAERDWLNSDPLTVADLRGSVALIERLLAES